MVDTERTLLMEPEGEQPAPKPAPPKRRPKRSRAARRFAFENVVPILVGIGAMALIYNVVLPAFPETGFLAAVRTKMTVHPLIPPLCTTLLFWHLSHVLLRLFTRVRPEFAAIQEDPIPASAEELSDEDMETISLRAIEMERRRGGSILTRRIILAVAHLRIRRDISELGDLLRRRADADRQRSATAWLLVAAAKAS